MIAALMMAVATQACTLICPPGPNMCHLGPNGGGICAETGKPPEPQMRGIWVPYTPTTPLPFMVPNYCANGCVTDNLIPHNYDYHISAEYVVHVKRLPVERCYECIWIEGDAPFGISIRDVCRTAFIVAGDLPYRMEAEDGTLTCKSGSVVSVVRKP